MVPPWWGIPVILVVGIAVVWFGWWYDRRRNQREANAVRKAPDRSLPGVDAGRTPAYVTEHDLTTLSSAEALTGDPHGFIARRTEAPSLPGGTHPVFLEDAGAHLATLAAPLVLVTESTVTDDRLLLPLLRHAQQAARPVVLVANGFTPEVVGTLRANALTGRIASLPITLSDPRDLRRAVSLSGGRLVDADDLASGFLPEQVWGTCQGWVCDDEDSWVILET